MYILHLPEECKYCADAKPLQEEREVYNRWPGNQAKK
jgi:hypothetical protein